MSLMVKGYVVGRGYGRQSKGDSLDPRPSQKKLNFLYEQCFVQYNTIYFSHKKFFKPHKQTNKQNKQTEMSFDQNCDNRSDAVSDWDGASNWSDEEIDELLFNEKEVDARGEPIYGHCPDIRTYNG